MNTFKFSLTSGCLVVKSKDASQLSLPDLGPAFGPLKLTTSWCSASFHSSPARSCWSPCKKLFLFSPFESGHSLGSSPPPFILYPHPLPEWSPSHLVILPTNWMLMMPNCVSPPPPPSPGSRQASAPASLNGVLGCPMVLSARAPIPSAGQGDQCHGVLHMPWYTSLSIR